MTETTVQIDGMMSIMDDAGVEKQIRRRDGVVKVDSNFLSGTATILYDEKRVALDDIKKLIQDCGYHCNGAALPEHVCEGVQQNGRLSAAKSEHHDHSVWVPPATQTKNEPPAKDAAMAGNHAGHDATKMPPGDKKAMAAGMGHGTGESMEEMVRGMRNRFFVTLFLTIPIYLYAPMFVNMTGPVREKFTKIAPQKLLLVNSAGCCCGMASGIHTFRDLKACYP